MSDKMFTVTLEFDQEKKNLSLSAPVYAGDAAAPKALAKYFTSLPSQGASSLVVAEDDQVIFKETLTRSMTMRQHFYSFLRRAQKCRHHLRCAANEEKLRDAQSLLES